MNWRYNDQLMYYIYILTNPINSVVYIGITNNLKRRLYEHKSETSDSFTKRYHLHKLVYYERFSHPQEAIAREKQLKGWKREKKNALVETQNPNWEDLSCIFYP